MRGRHAFALAATAIAVLAVLPVESFTVIVTVKEPAEAGAPSCSPTIASIEKSNCEAHAARSSTNTFPWRDRYALTIT